MDRRIIPALSFFIFLVVGCGGEESVKEPPLKGNMTLTYSISQSMGSKSLSKTETLRFEKTGDDQFLLHRTASEDFGDHEADPLRVDGFFIYNELLTANIGGNSVWMDPVQLASGKLKDLGKLEITEGTYNGREVYVLHWDEDYKAYYAKDTGLCEGSVQEIRDKQINETVVRVH